MFPKSIKKSYLKGIYVMSCAVLSGLLPSAKLCNQLKHKLFVSGCLNYS